jgi:hypothetical protein
VGLDWTVAGFGDFSGNVNETDMLMRNSNTGAFEVFDISNNAITLAGPIGQVGFEWTVAGIATASPTGAAASTAQFAQDLASSDTSAASTGPAGTIAGGPDTPLQISVAIPHFRDACQSASFNSADAIRAK